MKLKIIKLITVTLKDSGEDAILMVAQDEEKNQALTILNPEIPDRVSLGDIVDIKLMFPRGRVADADRFMILDYRAIAKGIIQTTNIMDTMCHPDRNHWERVSDQDSGAVDHIAGTIKKAIFKQLQTIDHNEKDRPQNLETDI